MADWFKDSRDFIRHLYHDENMPAIEIAKFCGIGWQVVSAIIHDDSYDMGTQIDRRILRKKIEWDKSKKQKPSFYDSNATLYDESTAYKGRRTIGWSKKETELSKMKPL